MSFVRRLLAAAACLAAASRDFADAAALTWRDLPRVFRLSMLIVFGAMAVGQVLQHTPAPVTLVAGVNALAGTRLSTTALSERPSIVDLARALDERAVAAVGCGVRRWWESKQKVKVRAGMKADAG